MTTRLSGCCCKGEKMKWVAQYALTGYDQPIGISDYQLAILELVLDKQKEQYTLILNSLKIEIEKNIRAYETKPLNDDVIKRVFFTTQTGIILQLKTSL